MNNRIFETSYENFDTEVIQASHQQPILVDLWADWCPPCVVIAPILEKVVNEWQTPIHLAKLEVDEGLNMKIAGQYKVRGFPTILLFHNGEEIGRFNGAKSRSFVEQFLVENLS
ncbi:MAG: thioredoxin domain-containing protein [Gammaproteobacteria bacterium]|nr:thioredoxin domain-containing protein [Gammaproteobacteria bacterium]